MAEDFSINSAFIKITELKGEINELKTSIIGLDGKNGLRGEVRSFLEMINMQDRKLDERLNNYTKQLNDRMDEQDATLLTATQELKDIVNKHQDEIRLLLHDHTNLKNEFKLYKDIERPATCIGKIALNDYVSKRDKEVIELKKTRIAMTATVVASLIAAISTITVTTINTNNSLKLQQINAIQSTITK